MHVGSDVRHISAFTQQYKIDTSGWEAGFFYEDLLNPKIQKIRYHELYADLIYSVPDQAGLYLRNYNHIRVPLSKNNNIVFNIPARKIPVIIHAPSTSSIKGTDIINATLHQLKNEGYEFEYKFIQNMPNEELVKLLSNADILCDELFLHGPGVLSAEAMAAGCAVATRCLNVEPFQPPVCSITPENILEKLKLLITDINFRTSLAKAAKIFVDEFNSPKNFAEKILNDMSNENLVSDYEPCFFIRDYMLPVDYSLSAKTKELTNQVIENYGLQQEALKYNLKKRGLI
ncbi:MAG: glycosyltransferase [Chitinophagaceae bacterium]|nr:glycosyltransferase [Chitinophagaceae bacterium]